MLRFRTLLVLIAAIAVPAWLWLRADLQYVTSPADSPNSPKSTIASTATGTDGRVPLPPPKAVEDDPTIATPLAADSGTASSEAPARTARSASVRLDVHAPSSARVGDLVTITIDAEAF